MMSSFNYHCLCLLFSLLLLLLTLLESSAMRCHPDDERVLMRIKAHFNNAPLFSSWIPQTPCCHNPHEWKHVSCDKLNNSNIFRVSFLWFDGEEGINGQIPSAIGDLPYLRALTFRNNPNLTGPIPPAIGKLTRLDSLSLDFNNLTGPIPPFLSRLRKLTTLDLNNNRLTGHIPSFLGRPEMTQLNLFNNRLTGPIPDTFGLLPDAAILRLSNNSLTGKIPTSLGRVNFMYLELSGNQLTGDALFLFGEEKIELISLDLSRNMLSFNLSKTVLPTLNTQLSLFDLSHNMIYGGLPSWLGEFTLLNVLNLSYNRLCGPITTKWGESQHFDASCFSNNMCLCGTPLPACS